MNDSTHWLTACAGKWHATNRLWFKPGDAAIEEPLSLTLDPVGDHICVLRYEWDYKRTTHSAVLLVRDAGEPSAPEMVFADSFHTGGTLLQLQDGQRTESSLTATGSYAAPPDPDWGWRIALESSSPNAMLLQMYNITPDGVEALAVEAKLERQ